MSHPDPTKDYHDDYPLPNTEGKGMSKTAITPTCQVCDGLKGLTETPAGYYCKEDMPAMNKQTKAEVSQFAREMKAAAEARGIVTANKGVSMGKTQGHTPGPWKVEEGTDEQNEYVLHIRSQDRLVTWIATLEGYDVYAGPSKTEYRFPEAQTANARLIASAPELLKASKDLIKAINARLSSDKQIPIASEICALADQIQWALSGKGV